MPNKLYQKCYRYNLKWWKALIDPYNKYEMHHVYGRIGIRLCCPILWQLAPRNHHNDYKWVNELKETHRKNLTRVEHNVTIKGYGCYEKISWHCDKCYFFDKV